MNKQDYIKHIFDEYVTKNGFTIDYKDINKPWGAYFALKENQAQKFANLYFPSLILRFTNALKPKFLLIKPYKRLSWQYHHRRSEIWKILSEDVFISLNKNNDENQPIKYKQNSILQIPVLTRHRLIGGNKWGLVAEIWKHENDNFPSDENDIVRLQDDFSRIS
jgi:mannose-6-phosphate isomerase-like protein (cupin superfamily)